MKLNKYIVKLPIVTKNGVPCPNPIVELVGAGDLLITCIDENTGTYTLEGDITDSCLTFAISCGDCDDCGTKVIDKCLCESDGDCGGCEICKDNICQTICRDGEYCLNDTCVECDPLNPCPDGKICRNGRCVCPPDKPFEVQGRCQQCIGDGIENCKECIDGVLVPLPCTGVCDPSTNNCVDCLIASDCDGDNVCCINKTCQCCEGFVRNDQGNCVPAPECTSDNDCGDCEICREEKCEPRPCPNGQVCVDGSGCVEECDCNDIQSCSDDTDWCKPANSDQCGCVECQGTCASGCEAPCYCNGTDCVPNPCVDGCPCVNGNDCPEGFGCDGNQCVPCSDLSCVNGECSQVLGCACIGNICRDADDQCSNAPCSVSGDCGVGCTCFEGQCVSCSNFSCDDCDRPGCECVGNTCQGTDDSCSDTFTITKDDSNCSITATLVKDECCSCSPITSNIRGRKLSETANTITLQFIAELRLGQTDGVATNLPLLDNVNHPDIAHNDSPTSGAINMVYTYEYDRYELLPNGTRGPRTIVSGSPATQVVTFLTGTTATKEFTSVAFNKIGFSSIEDNIELVVRKVTVVFNITSGFAFPNECTYTATGEIGRYLLNTPSAFNLFAANYSNIIDRVLTSSNCKLPMFRWFKSANGSVQTDPFRKIYVSGNGTYVDTISTLAQGAESCFYYTVNTDCTCADDPSRLIVFCNPSDLDYTLSECNFKLTLDSFSTCSANSQKQFRIRAGSINTTFNGSNPPVGQTFTSTSQITSVEFSLVCDTTGVCTKVYDESDNVFGDLTLNITPTCAGSGNGTFIVPANSANGSCQVVNLVVAGQTFVPGATVTLPNGSYTAVVSWACGCAQSPVNFMVQCCPTITAITRDCVGVNASPVVGVSYFSVANGVQTPIADLNTFVTNLPAQSTTSILATFPGCPSSTFVLGPIDTDCCSNFSATFERNTGAPTTATLTIFNASDIVVEVRNTATNILVPNPTPIVSGQTIVYVYAGLSATEGFTANITSTVCGFIRREIFPVGDGDCGLNSAIVNPQATGGACGVRATASAGLCPCQEGIWDVEVTNVLSSQDGNSWNVDFETFLNFYSAPVDLGVVKVTSPTTAGIIATYQNPEIGATVSVPKNTTSRLFRINGDVAWSYSGFGPLNPLSLTFFGFRITENGANVMSPPMTGTYRARLLGGAWQSVTYTLISAPPPTITLTNVPSSNVVSVEFEFIPNLGLAQNQVFTNIYSVDTIKDDSGTIPYTSTVNVTTNFDTIVRFTLEDFTLVDNCTYDPVTANFVIRQLANNSIAVNVVGNPNLTTATTVPIANPQNNRYKEWVWRKDTVEVFRDFQNTLSVLPAVYLEQGADYEVDVICNPCIETRELTYCCKPTIAASVDTCNTQITVSLSTNTSGDYDVTLDGVTQRITFTPNSPITQTTVFAPDGGFLPSNEYGILVEIVGASSCDDGILFTTNPPCPTPGIMLPLDARSPGGVGSYLETMKFALTFDAPPATFPNSVAFANTGMAYPLATVTITGIPTITTPADIIDGEFGTFGFSATMTHPFQESPYRSETMCLRGPNNVGNWTLTYYPTGHWNDTKLWALSWDDTTKTFSIEGDAIDGSSTYTKLVRTNTTPSTASFSDAITDISIITPCVVSLF